MPTRASHAFALAQPGERLRSQPPFASTPLRTGALACAQHEKEPTCPTVTVVLTACLQSCPRKARRLMQPRCCAATGRLRALLSPIHARRPEKHHDFRSAFVAPASRQRGAPALRSAVVARTCPPSHIERPVASHQVQIFLSSAKLRSRRFAIVEKALALPHRGRELNIPFHALFVSPESTGRHALQSHAVPPAVGVCGVPTLP